MLNGINALSGGAFSITEVTTDDSRVDWEKGTGVMMVEFKLNGTAYSYSAKKHNDWLAQRNLSRERNRNSRNCGWKFVYFKNRQ